MKIKTCELTDCALNWAVETLEIARFRDANILKEWWGEEKLRHPSPYCTDWTHGGEIVEREEISVQHALMPGGHNSMWRAYASDRSQGEAVAAVSRTPLVAAMRCYAISKLGHEVDVPDEML